MVTRNALIIECSEISGQDKLPGAVKDAAAWEDYLLSNRGGAWRSSEIAILSNPGKQDVAKAVSRMADGYGFVVFSGHGFVDPKTRETMACVQGSNISEKDLTPACPRSVVIMDSCRGFIELAFMESLRAVLKAETGDSRYRKLFDDAIERAEKGVCRMYGCSFEEAANESRSGGDFTQALIQSGKDWRNTGVFSLRDAFAAAERAVKRESQNPEFLPGRRLWHFPFAVNP